MWGPKFLEQAWQRSGAEGEAQVCTPELVLMMPAQAPVDPCLAAKQALPCRQLEAGSRSRSAALPAFCHLPSSKYAGPILASLGFRLLDCDGYTVQTGHRNLSICSDI